MEQQQRERLGYPPLLPLPALALILFQQEIPPRVGLAPSAPGGARVPFIVCLAEEWSCHISYFSAGGPLSVFGRSPRIFFGGGGLVRLAKIFAATSGSTGTLFSGTLGFNYSST